MNLNEKMLAAMRDATKALRDKRGADIATDVIQRTLQQYLPGGANMPNSFWKPDPQPAPAMRDINPPPQASDRNADSPKDFIAGLLDGLQLPAGVDLSSFELPGMNPLQGADAEPEPAAPGRFIPGSYTNHAGTRGYKLYIPTGYHGQSLPLVVMLHGCTQNPDDFAAGTRMNVIAEERQCFVVYPAQTQAANSSRCWNWFNGIDQQREQGEPSIIAGLTRDIIKTYHIDERQVFIAGMSAGGAMSVIMAATYPDLYAAVGIHSGLPYASAQDLPSALAAMKAGAETAPARIKGIPVIVFHGDKDHTVHPRNGEQIITQSLPLDGRTTTKAATEQGKQPKGRSYRRTVHQDSKGNAVAEHWVVHGSGHAWSGGSRRGSYTDPRGPDAGKEMMRFFTAQVPVVQSAD